MNLCKDCRWWRRGGHIDRVDVNSACEILVESPDPKSFKFWGPHKIAVLLGKHTDRLGMCLHGKMGSDCRDSWLGVESDRQVDGVYAASSEFRAYLIVGEHFGCIHWEAKP